MEDPKPGEQEKKRSRRKRLALALAAVLLTAGAAFAVAMLNLDTNGADDAWYDPNAIDGSYGGKSEEQIKRELNERVQEGSMNISICTVIRQQPGSGDYAARIENIAANRYDQQVSIYLDEDPGKRTGEPGEALYESGALAPGQTIENIRLARELEPGSHEATAVFTAYDRETREEYGALASKVTIVAGAD